MTPERLLVTTVKSLQDAEARIMTLIRRRLSYGQDSPAWATERLAETRALLSEVRILLADTLPDRAAVEAFLEDGWRRGVDWADKDVAAAQAALGARPSPWAVAPAAVTTATGATRLPNQLLALATATDSSLRALPTVIVRSTADLYQEAVLEAARLQATGTMSLGEAVKTTVDRLEQAGVRGFTDRAGRQWRADTYARMALRTAFTRSSNDARLTRYQDRGVTLVIVSDTFNECRLCKRWENQVLTTTAEVAAPPGFTVAGSVADALAAGLQHPNCRHLLNAYTPGLTRTPVEPDRSSSAALWPPEP